MRRPLILAATAGSVLALALAGCGSSSKSSTTNGSTAANSGSSGNSSGGGYGAPSTGSTTTAPATSSTGGAKVGVAHGKLGTFIVDPSGHTLYLFQKDKGTVSACTGACAAAWPPLLTKGPPTATGGAEAKLLGVSKRSDGTMQVTYAGHPLYTFSGDSAAGQTNGQGSTAFGGGWYVLTPNGGHKIDNS